MNTRDERLEDLTHAAEYHSEFVTAIRSGNSMLRLNVASAILHGSTTAAVHLCLEIVRQTTDINQAHRDITRLLNLMVHECT